MRQERMESEAREKDLDVAFEAKQRALREQEEARTAKRRAKRLKKKVRECCHPLRVLWWPVISRAGLDSTLGQPWPACAFCQHAWTKVSTCKAVICALTSNKFWVRA